VVQKPLYPEGEAVCHTIVVHPPAGIAGGDELDIKVQAGARTAVLLTTPGAGKWYRSAGAWATQHVALRAADGAMIEWLPQETIVYDGALAELRNEVDLEGNAGYIGWEILCLGRTGSGERYTRGTARLATRIRRDGRTIWFERGVIEGGGGLLASQAGLQGKPVCATLVAAGPHVDLAACREIGELAVTQLPGVLVARYLGDSSETAKKSFARLWALLRPAIAGRIAHDPRIWRT
jgi:urease accessory protein